MAFIGSIPASTNGVLTLDHLPEVLLIIPAGSVAGAANFDDITNIQISQSGRQLVTLSSANRIKGSSQIGIFASPIGGTNGVLRLGEGRKNGSVTMAINNTGAAACQVYASSGGFSDLAYNYVENSINPNANYSVSNFDALLIEFPAQVSRINVTFEDGFNDDFTPDELQALLGFAQNTNSDGTLGDSLMIRGAGIRSVVVYNGGLASTIVVTRTLVNLA